MTPSAGPARSGVASTGWLRLVLGLALILTFSVVPGTAHAEDPGELTVAKSVEGWDDGHVVTPGETFTYTIRISCSNIGSGGCTNAVLTDPLPDGLVFAGDASSITVQPDGAGTASISGTTVTVTFTEELTDPAGGDYRTAAGGDSVTIRIAGQAITLSASEIIR